MKKWDKQMVKGFVIGVLASVLVATTIAPAAASALREIRVSMGGIKIYVDGNLKKPTDAKGNVVEPLIYDGTTYLPVRALTGMLTDKEVSWDGNTETVYIGKRPDTGVKSVALDTLKPFESKGPTSGAAAPSMYKETSFSILGEKTACFNCIKAVNRDSSITYKVNSEYQSIHGKFVLAYDKLGSSVESSLGIYSVDQYGEETLLKEYSAKCGDAPVDVEVNISGCNFIKFKMGGWSNVSSCFYDITLTTAE